MKHEYHINLKYLLISLFAALVSYLIPLGFDHNARIVFSVLVLALFLWVSEAIPLWLTSLWISLILVLAGIFTFNVALTKFVDSVLMLIFAGFLIARVVQKQKLDKRLALIIASRLTTPKYVLLALMFTTAFLSMWMSNTATTLIMIPLALAVVGSKRTKFCKGSALGIAFAANIGGLGTIIGSPPNAIAVASLDKLAGVHVSFLTWMIYAIPLVIVLIPLSWIILVWMFPPGKDQKSSKIKDMGFQAGFSNKDKLFFVIFVFTLGGWVTTTLHGFSATMVAMTSIGFMFLTGLLDKHDTNKISWDTLILFGGGLVLGSAMFETGLSEYFADKLTLMLSNTPAFFVILGIVLFAVLLSTFVPNTASAAILLPMLIPLATKLSIAPKVLGLLAGMAVSLNFLLPVGTPPNAIAYSFGHIRIKDMFKAGSVVALVSIAIISIYSYMFW